MTAHEPTAAERRAANLRRRRRAATLRHTGDRHKKIAARLPDFMMDRDEVLVMLQCSDKALTRLGQRYPGLVPRKLGPRFLRWWHSEVRAALDEIERGRGNRPGEDARR